MDLNQVVAPGLYRQPTFGLATLQLNYPLAGISGLLEVTETLGSTNVLQRYTVFGGGANGSARLIYARRNNGGTWDPWRAFTSTRVDQTAGRAIYQWDELNAREQLIYGDTGWRDISTLMVNGFLGSLLIRRMGNTVTLRGSVRCPVGTASMNGTFVSVLPTSFTPGSSAPWVFFPVRSNVGTTWFTLYRKQPELTFEGSPTVGDANETRFEISFSTTDAWPTTLPGTASGSIPAL
jgi:hypothetical protein